MQRRAKNPNLQRAIKEEMAKVIPGRASYEVDWKKQVFYLDRKCNRKCCRRGNPICKEHTVHIYAANIMYKLVRYT